MTDIWSQDEEAERLSARFKALKEQGIGQAKFARDHKFPGLASMVSQIIKGRRPMTLEHAIIFAAGFGCSLEEISPRLAAEVSAASKVASISDSVPWPFKSVTPNQYYNLLTDEIRDSIEQTAMQFVKARTPEQKHRAPEKASRAA